MRKFATHIPDALNVGLISSFATWAGTVLPADPAHPRHPDDAKRPARGRGGIIGADLLGTPTQPERISQQLVHFLLII
jgi:hypothetical protein